MVMHWRDAKNFRDQERMVEEALLRAKNSVTAAAQMLGVSRRHLTRFMTETRRLREIREKAETSEPTEKREKTETTETPETTPGSETRRLTQGGETRDGTRGGETTTVKESLTYERPARTFATTMSTAVETRETQEQAAEEPTVRVNLDFPKSVNDHCEMKALVEKQRSGASRASKSAYVIRLVREDMERERAKGGSE